MNPLISTLGYDSSTCYRSSSPTSFLFLYKDIMEMLSRSYWNPIKLNQHSVSEWVLLSHGWLFETPWTAAHQTSLPMEFSFFLSFFLNIIPFYFLKIIYLLYFTTLYWFCHTLTWIRHGCTCVPHPEPLSHLPPCPWNFQGKNTGMACHFLLQGIFPTQESNWCLWHLLPNPALAGGFFTTSATWESQTNRINIATFYNTFMINIANK